MDGRECPADLDGQGSARFCAGRGRTGRRHGVLVLPGHLHQGERGAGQMGVHECAQPGLLNRTDHAGQMEGEVRANRWCEGPEDQVLGLQPDAGLGMEGAANTPPLILCVFDHARPEVRIVVRRRTGRYRGDTGHGCGGNGCEQFGGRSHLIHTTGRALSTGTTVTHSRRGATGTRRLQWTGDSFRTQHLDTRPHRARPGSRGPAVCGVGLRP